MKVWRLWGWVFGMAFAASGMWGCATQAPPVSQSVETGGPQAYAPGGGPPAPQSRSQLPAPPLRPSAGWRERVLSEQDLLRLSAKDPDLSPSSARQILSRLNARAPYYIEEDIRSGRPLKVPNDFSAYKTWSPLPRTIPEVRNVPKFILIVKGIPFLGWYERGKIVSDTYICVGREEGWTQAGLYTVKEKDPNHVSMSYKNAFGVPAPMPWALRIYEHVWIHAGDIERGNCSHGCINLPLMPAMQLYKWASAGTVVLVVDSLGETPVALRKNLSTCLLSTECTLKLRD